MIEQVTLVFTFGGLVGFVMHNRWNRCSLFPSRASQGKLNRSELVLTPNVCKIGSKALVRFSEAAAQLTDHLCWK